MKKYIANYGLALIVFTVILSSCTASNNVQDTPQQVDVPAADAITYQAFYDDLSPYGTWIDYPGYGHVWNPGLGADFRPYATNGHWVYSDEGWAWASDYNWGWAPFHYGRWIYDDMYGWLWIPGYDWSPAWVTWGFVDNYYCWAPLMPGVNVGAAFGAWMPHSIYWNICDKAHIYDRNLTGFLQRPEIVNNIRNRITVINNFSNTKVHNSFYSRGPQVNEVEKFTSHRINPVSIKEVDNARLVKHENNEMRIYRPQVQNPQPRQFRRIDKNDARPIQSIDDKLIGQRREQADNVNRLPTHNAPAGAFGHFRGGNRRR